MARWESGGCFSTCRPRKLKGGKGLGDGLKVDRAGNVWATGPGGVMVISPAVKLLGVINTNEPMANCCWGDDGHTLYITANYFRVRVKTLTRFGKMTCAAEAKTSTWMAR